MAATNLLAQVITGVQEDGPRFTILYGEGGIGKSTFAAGHPKHLILDFDKGLRDIDCASLPESSLREYSDVIGVLSALIKSEHSYELVAFDTGDALERVIFADVCREEGVESIEKIPYGKGYTYALDRWRQVVRGCRVLMEGGVHILFLMHAQVQRIQEPTSDAYDKFTIKLHKKAAKYMVEAADEVFFAHQEVSIIQKDGSFGQKRNVTLVDTPRFMECEPQSHWIAKHRHPRMKARLPLDFRAYAEIIWPKEGKDNG